MVSQDGEAKFWLTPKVLLAKNFGFSKEQICELEKVVEEHRDEIEVSHIDVHGLWLAVRDKEYFLSYDKYPWFKDAGVGNILNVELLHGFHLYWPELDVDLDIDSLSNPQQYPLRYI